MNAGMLYCGHTMGVPGMDLPDALRLFRRLGYDGIEVRCAADGQIDPERIDERKLEALAASAEGLGMRYACLTPYYRDFFGPAAAESVSGLLRVVQIARILRCPLVRTYAGIDPPPSDWTRDRAWTRTVETLRRVADAAGELGIGLCVETHDGSLTQRSGEILSLVDAVGRANVGILFDYAWVWDAGETDAARVVRDLAPHVRHCHYKDWKIEQGADGCRVRRAVLMGRGDIPWPAAFQALERCGYRGFCSDEYERYWHPEDLPPAETGMRANLEYVKGLRTAEKGPG